MIKVTEKAADHLKGISDSNDNKIPVLGLRGGGCAGFSYEWKLKEESELDNKADHVILMDNGCKMAVQFKYYVLSRNNIRIETRSNGNNVRSC